MFVPLIDSDVNNMFQDTFNELKKEFDCNYIYYQYQYRDFKLTFATHQEWSDVYINQSLIKHCSLIRIGLHKIALSKTSSVVLRWNDVSPISKQEKNTLGIRTEFNICNGISFGRKTFGVSDYFGLASDAKNFDFPRNIILNSKKVGYLMDNLFRAASIKLLYNFINTNNSKSINTKLLMLGL